MKITTGASLGLSAAQIESLTKGRFAQYRRAAKSLLTNGYYRRGASQRLGGKIDIYYLSNDGRSIESLCVRTTPHRAAVLLKALKSGSINNIDHNIINNYATNGYMTRRGLYANYTQHKVMRIADIARSHADYLGNETGSSTQDHHNRVLMRNYSAN